MPTSRADVFRITSDKDVHFTDALATNTYEQENIVVPTGNKKFAILQLSLKADQGLACEIYVFGKDTFSNADLDLDTAIARITIATTDYAQYGATGTYYASKQLSAPIIYVDDDAPTSPAELHIAYLNKDTTSKITGATGEVTIELTCEPVG